MSNTLRTVFVISAFATVVFGTFIYANRGELGQPLQPRQELVQQWHQETQEQAQMPAGGAR